MITVYAAVDRIAGSAIPCREVCVATIAMAMEEETPMIPAMKCSVLISNTNFIRGYECDEIDEDDELILNVEVIIP
jgi:hypothetical protein